MRGYLPGPESLRGSQRLHQFLRHRVRHDRQLVAPYPQGYLLLRRDDGAETVRQVKLAARLSAVHLVDLVRGELRQCRAAEVVAAVVADAGEDLSQGHDDLADVTVGAKHALDTEEDV
jgi:hypothetical protein